MTGKLSIVSAGTLLWLMVGLRKAESIRRPFKGLQRKGIEVRLGEIEKIDPEARRVTVAGETIAADHLLIALGAELAPETVPGLQEAGHNFYNLAGAASLHEALGSRRGANADDPAGSRCGSARGTQHGRCKRAREVARWVRAGRPRSGAGHRDGAHDGGRSGARLQSQDANGWRERHPAL